MHRSGGLGLFVETCRFRADARRPEGLVAPIRTDVRLQPSHAMTPEEKINILVVDDVPQKLLAMEAILSELDQNVVTVGSGREALRQLLERDFAVILLDVNMP